MPASRWQAIKGRQSGNKYVQRQRKNKDKRQKRKSEEAREKKSAQEITKDGMRVAAYEESTREKKTRNNEKKKHELFSEKPATRNSQLSDPRIARAGHQRRRARLKNERRHKEKEKEKDEHVFVHACVRKFARTAQTPLSPLQTEAGERLCTSRLGD